jgi:hypothetical protein
MDSDRYMANADFQSNTEQIVDLMRLCVSDLDRLQGVSNTPAVLMRLGANNGIAEGSIRKTLQVGNLN